jgi:hypothetical protein
MKRFLQLLMVLGLVSAVVAQETPKGPIQKIYRVVFLIYEVEDGKKINERTYTLAVMSVDGKPRDSSMRVGTRVPIAGGDKQVQYIDVGLSIGCNVTEQEDRFIVHGDVDLSSFAMRPDQDGSAPSGGNPVLRNVRETFTTLVVPGKPTTATTMDDINSKKRLQVEVTATRIE